MIVFASDNTCERGVSHWRKEEEAVESESSHTLPPSELRQSVRRSLLLIEALTSDLPEPMICVGH